MLAKVNENRYIALSCSQIFFVTIYIGLNLHLKLNHNTDKNLIQINLKTNCYVEK